MGLFAFLKRKYSPAKDDNQNCIPRDFYKENDRNSEAVWSETGLDSKKMDSDRIRYIDQIAKRNFLYLEDKKGLYADEKFTDRFYVLYSNYQILLEKFLLKELPLGELNRKLIHSGLRFLELPAQKKDVYQRLSGMGLEYIYLRNYLHVEKLPEEIICHVENLTARKLTYPDNTLMDLIRRTYRYVLSAAEDSDDVSHMVCYGYDADHFWHDSRDLIFGVIHDESGDNGLGENGEWLDNYFKQMAFLGVCINEQENRCSEILGIKVHFLYYNDVITKDTMPMR